MISALVLTYNEENIIAKCLDALSFIDELIVFDSYSHDDTILIAQAKGATVFQRVFDNYSNQRNEALKKVSKKADWILMIDADEIVTPCLQKEIINITKKNTASLYRVRRKDMFEGKWLRYSSGYPTWFPRLFKNGDVFVERAVNEEYKTNGKIGHLKEHLIHYSFNKGLGHWFSKHNKYSDLEAQLMISEINEKIKISNLFSLNPVLRRQAQKRLSYHIPFRPNFIFFTFLILKGGFLDGRSGYHFCKLRKIYETMIDLKFKALKSKHES